MKTKEFWSYCIMFVTDNNSFDKLTIDYLEYKFIEKFRLSSYLLENRELREKEPNISVFDEAKLKVFIGQIEFLLLAEGNSIDIQEGINSKTKYYYPSKNYSAKVFIKDGKFILEKGSHLKRIDEKMKENYLDFYRRYEGTINEYIDSGKAKEKDNIINTMVNLEFKKPSKPAVLVSGKSQNRWVFFRGLNELRNSK